VVWLQEPGAIVGVIGANGSGKSTLFNILAGLNVSGLSSYTLIHPERLRAVYHVDMGLHGVPVLFCFLYVACVLIILQTPDSGTVERGNTVRLGLVAQLRSDLNANKTVYEVGTYPFRHPTHSLTSHLHTVFFLRHTCVYVRVGDCAVGGLHHGGRPDCEHSGLRGGLQPQGRHAGEAGQQHF
jgi:energy-coupling factor transporter ATP-binding protein EcfA2